jgi:glyoxylase-like metal-dependent hydrolase (beta-lactamase superfamily II)
MARVDLVVTHGVFSIDGEDFEVDNNIWLVGNDDEVLVIDAAHDHQPIVDGIAGREVVVIIATHGHNDHINAAVALADATGASIALHPADRMLWDVVYPNRAPDLEIHDGDTFRAGGVEIVAMHTPGHSPGGVSLYDAATGELFGGDTLFKGGPGATGRSFSSREQILESIRTRILTLPPGTVVHTGHGDDTTVAAETPALA